MKLKILMVFSVLACSTALGVNCDSCHRYFKTNDELEEHIRMVHCCMFGCHVFGGRVIHIHACPNDRSRLPADCRPECRYDPFQPDRVRHCRLCFHYKH